MILVDTSVLIDHLRGRAEPRERLREALLSGEPLAASVVTKVEILGPVRSSERASVATLFSVLDWLPVSDQIAEDAGALALRFRRSHGTIDVVDYFIAATARRHDASLWTRNVRHFPMFEGLATPY